uniref:Uncharacterized protein n=1 Tax=Oryza nivara TaxID=4536 RepID=A0A0E0HRC9_ORYNI
MELTYWRSCTLAVWVLSYSGFHPTRVAARAYSIRRSKVKPFDGIIMEITSFLYPRHVYV